MQWADMPAPQREDKDHFLNLEQPFEDGLHYTQFPPCHITGRTCRDSFAGGHDAPFPLSAPARTSLGLQEQASVQNEAGNSHLRENFRKRVRNSGSQKMPGPSEEWWVDSVPHQVS